MTYETLGNNQKHGTSSLVPLEEPFWIFECLDLLIRLSKRIRIEGKTRIQVKFTNNLSQSHKNP